MMDIKHVKMLVGALLILVCIKPGLFAAPVSPTFKAAFVSIDITPDEPKMLLGYAARKSEGIHDRIYHKIVVLDDGISRFFLVSTDICVLSPSEYDHVASLLKKKLGIDPQQFWWSVTHTHSAPEVGVPGLPESFMKERYEHAVDVQYTTFVEQTLIQGIEEAIGKLEPVRLGVGWGFSQANINRRTWGENKKAAFGMNPDGAVDRKIGLLRLEKADGSTLALLANYAIHGTVLGPGNLKISGDVTGTVAEYVEKKTGAPLVFINGAAGNLAPVYSVYPNPSAGHLDQFNVLLGDRIIEASKNIHDVLDSIRFYTGEVIVKTPRKSGMTEWPSYLKKYTSVSGDGKTNYVNLPIRFFRINNTIAVWSAPLELFCEISNSIRDQSPFPYTFYFGYTNGWLGYLPTAKAWENGGYEVHTVSPYTISAEKDLKDHVLTYLLSDAFLNNKTGDMNRKKKTKK
ncbi:MAG: neutral/alkaline non-lysosomal ceramidase N-terminal domain-containing protein [Chitinophagaceae bacterium]|nr:neutral/alkaline non-lysosomal ceramidase N-terminal domain-containing protein [Chitinophagaceae bacterium]MCW5926450.1 neutral/alkaline non-lysosomal ceramidase N-terminal domain-containing protein [Chitinophagaceae bacterium]